MSIHQQHERFIRDIRSGHAHASDLEDRYEPYTTSFGCLEHMIFDDDKCEGCRRRAREREEDRQVDRYRAELWREQRYYDQEQAAQQKAADAQQARKDQKDAERAARDARPATGTTPDPTPSHGRGHGAAQPHARQRSDAAPLVEPPFIIKGGRKWTLPVTLADAKARHREAAGLPPLPTPSVTGSAASAAGADATSSHPSSAPGEGQAPTPALPQRGTLASLLLYGAGAGVLYLVACVVMWLGRTYLGWV